jgi:hypothetical protein
MERAKSGTGLTFERPAESRYYEEVGRINLNEPLVYEDKDSLFIDNELPAGVLEFRDGKFTCIRSKDRFVHLLSYLGLIPSFKKGSEHQDLVDPVPENLLHATERCTRVDGWVQFALGRGEEQEYTCYLRRVASNDLNDSVALLAVLLTTQIN